MGAALTTLCSVRRDRLFLLPVGLFVALAVLLPPGSADGRKKFAKREDKKCEHCHKNPNGGGPRNLTGMYYQATGSLPGDMDEERQRETVKGWLDDVASRPPALVWRYTPLDELPDHEPPVYTPAADHEVLRRLSLDLRQVPPTPTELARLANGSLSLEQLTRRYLRGNAFRRTFMLYHKDLVRPRTGIFNKPASLTKVVREGLFGDRPWRSTAIDGERARGGCDSHNLQRVTPYWDREDDVLVCRESARTDLTVEGDDGQTIDCATDEGQATGECGCGPNLVFCYRDGDRGRVKRSMLQEGARMAMHIVEHDLPYSEILTGDWTVWNGRLEHFYARLDGRLGELREHDVERRWRRVEREPKHAGILSTHSYLNFFYNGRRWAQRTFESFLCHETTPDYDLLDEHEDEPPVSYRRHPTAGPDINVASGRACAACHLQLDGLSRVKDRWDNFGQDWSPRAEVPNTIRFLGEEVNGLNEFGWALGKSDVFLDCAMNQAWEHMVGHRFRPEETRTRLALLDGWKQRGLRFRALLELVARTEEYRAKENVKIMERELYVRALERLTGVKWRVGRKRGFDLFYDKVGGMDYRKIESRDRTPGQGHSLVQYKGAAETCDEVVRRDRKKERNKRKLLRVVDDVDASPSAGLLLRQLNDWYLRAYGWPPAGVPQEDRAVMVDLFRTVETEHSTADAYKAACTALFGAADFALY